MPVEEYSGEYDYKLYIEKDVDIDEKINLFFSSIPVVGDKSVVISQIKTQITEQRQILESISKEQPSILGKSIAIKHYVVPELNNNKEFFIYLINVFY